MTTHQIIAQNCAKVIAYQLPMHSIEAQTVTAMLASLNGAEWQEEVRSVKIFGLAELIPAKR
jgi:hypothetical protein